MRSNFHNYQISSLDTIDTSNTNNIHRLTFKIGFDWHLITLFRRLLTPYQRIIWHLPPTDNIVTNRVQLYSLFNLSKLSHFENFLMSATTKYWLDSFEKHMIWYSVTDILKILTLDIDRVMVQLLKFKGLCV